MSDVKNFFLGMEPPLPDPGALFRGAFPFFLGTKVGKPEGIGRALNRTNGINLASVPKEKTASVRVLPDAVAILKGIQMPFLEGFLGKIQEFRDGPDFRLTDVDGARFPGAAVAALLALKAESAVEKIGSIRNLAHKIPGKPQREKRGAMPMISLIIRKKFREIKVGVGVRKKSCNSHYSLKLRSPLNSGLCFWPFSISLPYHQHGKTVAHYGKTVAH